MADHHPGVVTHPTVVVVENPALKLRRGNDRDGDRHPQRHTGVLRVPNAALRYQPGAFSGDGGTSGHHHGDAPHRGADGVRHGTVHLLRATAARRPWAVTVGIVDDATEVTGVGSPRASRW